MLTESQCCSMAARYDKTYLRSNNTTSKGVITALKNIFACHGLPETLLSDNGPHYSLHDMKEFASTYEFVHTTSSPHNPRSNGLAERTVKTIKNLMNKSSDVNFLLLNYHSNPLHRCNLSPSELLMERRMRTALPQVPKQLIPQWNFRSKFCDQDTKKL